MPRSQLRVYYGPETSPAPKTAPENRVRMKLSEVLPLLADAVSSRRTWLRDFNDDEVEISTDLHEVILAYQYCRRPSA